MTLVLAVLSGFVVACAAPWLAAHLRSAAGWVLALLPAALAAYFISLLPAAAANRPLTFFAPWVPSLGVNLSLRADGLGLLLALLVSGVGTLVVCYAGGYLKGHPQLGRFYGWLLMFMAAMLGVALADNILLLFVFWELTSLSSYGLIGFDHERDESRAAALQALLVTAGGGLALMAGLILLGLAGGTWEISALVASAPQVQASPLYIPALALILIGAFTKSAQFPFHFWLPNAMEAPTPVSAYLHSATMVKAGIYLLARLFPVLGGSDFWVYVVGGIGGVTMLVGAYLALSQTDLKRLLAYSTVSTLGMLTLLLGLGTPLAIEAAMTLFLAHALYKGTLFLVAGVVDHEAGTRDVTLLRGLGRAMPITATAAGIAAFSMAGIPPLFGFIAKELTYEAALAYNLWVGAAMVCANVAAVFIAAVVGVGPFWGGKDKMPNTPHEAPVSLWLGPVVLAGLGLAMGLVPALIGALLITPAAAAVLGPDTRVSLALWHGLTPVLGLSGVTVAGGAWLYVKRQAVRRWAEGLTWDWGPSWVYTWAIDGLNAVAYAQTRVLQHGYLRYYLLTILITTMGLVGFTLVGWQMDFGAVSLSLRQALALDARFYEVALAVLIILASLAATLSRSGLGAVASMGAAGYGVALIYLLFGAPDLATTQILVETLTVILFVLAFYHLPDLSSLSPVGARVRDGVIALAAGGLMTMLVLLAVSLHLYPSISAYFIDTALPLAHGRNIVNVILVDFRALDTLGEMTVLGIAAVGVYALLKLPRARGK